MPAGCIAMTLRVRLGPFLAEKVGQPVLRIETVEGSPLTAANLRALVARLYPALAPHLLSALVVAEGRVLGPDQPVLSGEVALLPPAAGGA